jgi:D-arabinose 1-dehydrogenase-like Zn-dependent alcohol dehydrogenase
LRSGLDQKLSEEHRMPKAYAFMANGGPEVAEFLDRPRPVPGPGQLLVRVQAAGVSPAGWKRRAAARRLRLAAAGHARGKIVLEVGE